MIDVSSAWVRRFSGAAVRFRRDLLGTMAVGLEGLGGKCCCVGLKLV